MSLELFYGTGSLRQKQVNNTQAQENMAFNKSQYIINSNQEMRWRGLEISGALAFENKDNADHDVNTRYTSKHK